MKRIGKFTGSIYKADEKMNECSSLITDAQAKDEEYLQKIRKKNSEVCKLCGKCEGGKKK